MAQGFFPCDSIADVSPRFPGDALAMNKRDRDAVLDAASATRQPIKSILDLVCAGTDASSETVRRRLRTKLYATGKIDTLYGELFHHLDV